VHCASLWRLAWDEGQTYQSLFYYLLRHHGLHVYEQFGHFVTEVMDEADLQRISAVILAAVDELLALGLLRRRDGLPPPNPPTAAREGVLTPGQSERWLAASFDASAMRALNETLRLQLRGDIDMAALQRALQHVCERHDAFVTAFDTEAPLQRLSALRAVPVLHDLRSESDPAQAAELLLEAQRVARFTLDQAPLLNIDMLCLDDQQVVVHLVANHMVFDGWASSVWLRELATSYHAFARGQLPALPPAGSAIAFAAQVQAEFDSAAGDEDLAWWQSQMQDLPAALSLGDLDPPAQRCFSAHTVQRRLQGDAWQALQARASVHKATIFQWLLCEVGLWLKRETGQSDFLLSLPWAAQNFGRHPALIADGVLDLPLRLCLPDVEQCEQALPIVRDALFDALEHPRVTQGRLARALQCPPRGDRPPLTGIYFNLNPGLDLHAFEPLLAELSEGRKPGLLGELIFNFYEDADALSLDLHYSDEFFSAERIESLLSALWACFGGERCPVIDDPVKANFPSRARADGLNEEDIRRLLQWNATDVAWDLSPRLGDLLQQAAKRFTTQTALRFEGQSISYGQLDAWARSLAESLVRQGIGPGQRVGICIDRSIELIVALISTIYSGAAYVPLDPGYPQDRLRQMCEDAQLVLVLSRGDELRLVSDALAGQRVQKLDLGALPLPSLHALPKGNASDPAYIIFTSGSTGRPKGATNSHRGIVNRLLWMQSEFQLGLKDRVLQKTPSSFDVSVWEFFLPLMYGATLVIARPDGHRDAQYLLKLVRDEAISLMHFVPSMLRAFLDQDMAGDLSALRQVVCSGEALPFALVERFFAALPKVRLANLYGPTEAAVDVTCWHCSPGEPRSLVPIGRPIANTRMHILGDQQELLPVGATGEIWIAGVQVGLGYFGRPELSAERFVDDPFQIGSKMYRTGDLGRWLNDGSIEYLGRADHQIKLRGYRIELGEIEAALEQVEGVAQAVVVAEKFAEEDVRLVAHLTTMTGRAARGLGDIRSALARRLPEFMLPQHVRWHDHLPLLSSGKVDRKSLPAVARREVDPPAKTPDRVEELCQYMAAVLQHDVVTADDNFFSLGGHSLLAAQLAARIRRQWQVKLGLRDLFEAPTPRQLATRLRAQAVDADDSSALTASKQSSGPLSAQQQRLWFAERLSPGQTVAHVPVAFELRGAVDQAALHLALLAVQQQQPSLRSALMDSSDGLGQQRIEDDVALPFQAIVLSKQSRASALMQDALDAMLDEPFDLQQGPLWRVRLFVLDSQRCVLAAVFHHLIWDGASVALWWRALATAYAAAKSGVAIELPTPDHTVIDYAHWQRAQRDSATMRQTQQFWRNQLDPLPPPLALPCDYPRPSHWQSEAEVIRFSVPTALRQAMQIRAQQLGLAPVVLWLQAWATTLARRAGQRDVLVGMLAHGRDMPEWSTLAGFFARALPLCLRGLDTAHSGQLSRDIAAALHAALAHAELAIEQLVQQMDLPRDPSRALLLQNTFSFEQDNGSEIAWPGLRVREWPMPLRGAEHDVGLWLQADRDRMEGVLVGAAALFSEASLRALVCDTLDAAAQLCGLAALGSRWPSINIQSRGQKALPARDFSSVQTQNAPPALSASTELMLSLWRDLLQVQDIDPTLSFVAQGGHSLLMMQLAARIESEFGTRLPLRTIVEAPDLLTLVRAIETERVTLAPIPSLDLEIGVPLSPMQTRLWHAEQLEPGKPTYHIVPTGRLDGPLNVSLLKRAVDMLTLRHGALRTQFFIDALGRARQRCAPSMGLPFELIDLSGLCNASECAAAVESGLREVSLKPFDLQNGPLLRAYLFRLDLHTHVLCFVVHHIISDGWSLHLLFHDLAYLYDELRCARTPEAYPATVRHADFAAWLRERAEGESLQDDIDFWTQQLTPPPEPLALPLDFPMPPQPTREAGHVLIEVEDTLRAQLRTAARGLDTTLFVLTLSAYAMLLHHATGQDDLVIAVPVRGRHRADVEDVFGYFANVLPLRIQIQLDATPRSLIRQVQTQVKAAMSHAEAPLERVAEVLAQRGQRGVLYHTLFGFQDDHQRVEQFADLRLSDWLTSPVGIAETLTVWMWDNQEGQKAYLTYRRDLFEADSMQRLAERFVQLLQTFADLQSPTLAALPRATRRDLADQQRWNQTERDYPRQQNLAEFLCAALATRPERTAIRFEAVSLSAADVLARSERIALALQARGIGRGQRVGLGLERGIDLVPVLLGVLRAGAAYVPLDPAFPEARLRMMAEDAGLSAVLVDAPDRLPSALCEAPVLLHHQLLAEATPSAFDSRHTPGVTDAGLRHLYLGFDRQTKRRGRAARPRGQLPAQHGARAWAVVGGSSAGRDDPQFRHCGTGTAAAPCSSVPS
jgi:amino acid adenylation domain-containing protein